MPVEEWLGRDRLFVPYQPVRPQAYWPRLQKWHGASLTIRLHLADHLQQDGRGWVVSVGADRLRAQRVWLAAGALGTPRVLQRSPGLDISVRSHVSDHVILYLGQIDRRAHPDEGAPAITRTPSGIVMPFRTDALRHGVVTTKPARFDYRRLDHGIAQRAAFGLPTAGVIGKLLRAGSPGLVAESLFNKFGLFPAAQRLSVYAQVRVEDAFRVEPGGAGLTPMLDVIQRETDRCRAALAWPALTPSRRTELFVRGIHLHRSLDASRLSASGLHVADASLLDRIGPEHHSFAVMARAMVRAQESA